MAFEDLAGVGGLGPGALGPAALDQGDLVGRMSWPDGAITPMLHASTVAAGAPPAQRQLRSHAADSATPPTPTKKTTPMAHSTRATCPSGAAAWLMARVARGTPPNGKVRAASARVKAPGSASQRSTMRGPARHGHAGDPDVGAEDQHRRRVPGRR